MSKCSGCGAVLTNDATKEGYTTNVDSNLCQRCFRIRNYNEYQFVAKDNNDYIDILKGIDKNSLVVLAVDLLNINNELSKLSEIIDNDILLVLTKCDLLPSNNEEKFINYFKSFNLKIVDSVVISNQKNYHFDLLFQKINSLKNNSKVYVIGYTNAGKSSMINKIIYNYSNSINYITTSNLPSTTLNTIEIKMDDLVLVDTPGLLDDSIINYVDLDILKKIIPKQKIKPLTFQIKSLQTIMIENIVQIRSSRANITIYMSNQLNVKRYYKEINDTSLTKHVFRVHKNEEIVILGLGFIHVSTDSEIEIFVYNKVSVFLRKALIGS